jgi:hypothetical protein
VAKEDTRVGVTTVVVEDQVDPVDQVVKRKIVIIVVLVVVVQK